MALLYPSSSVNTDTTLSNDYQVYLADASGGSFTLTLPANDMDGVNFTIKRTDSTSINTLTLTGTLALINGQVSIDIQIFYAVTVSFFQGDLGLLEIDFHFQQCGTGSSMPYFK